MELTYVYSGIARGIESILEFTDPSKTAFWSAPFFHFFPDIDRAELMALDKQQKKAALVDYFSRFERENKELIEEKLRKYNERWWQCRPQIVSALEEAFSLDLTNLFNDMTGHLAFNPVCPRFLEDNSFDVFYLNREKGALGIAIHEIIHFVWFYVWNRYFQDDPREYEAPHLKWILSEMVVEPIMRDERLASINPYFTGGGCVYPYFYTLEIEDKPILDTLFNMLRAMGIREFMEAGYQFCQEHEVEIRRHMEENENK